MSLDAITETIRAKVAQIPPFGHTVLFDLGDAGVVHLDGVAATAMVTNERREAETTLTLSAAALEGLLDGSKSPTFAYMTGELKIAGSMGVALKLNSLFED
ncbi:MAG TPA: SCP2 sterol-binding domain-containing protein [Stellaceae bacterium]|nr:SCP2 sterol-binding domain-containing protein [Stellaceae bacterium]